MKYDGIIFDWAGTTVDYGCFAPVKAFINGFEAFGITPNLEEVRKPMGMLKKDHIRTMFEMDRITNLWKEIHNKDWNEYDVDKVYKISEEQILNIVGEYSSPKPYVIETIEKVREMGLKIGSTTGYTDEMMAIVTKKANEYGYKPDCWFGPNSVNNFGRPYPYMIFKNMYELGLKDVSRVIKVGDTISDILEGKNAGVVTVGVIEGSSVSGITEDEYNKMNDEEREKITKRVEQLYKEAGADYVIKDIRGIIEIIK